MQQQKYIANSEICTLYRDKKTNRYNNDAPTEANVTRDVVRLTWPESAALRLFGFCYKPRAKKASDDATRATRIKTRLRLLYSTTSWVYPTDILHLYITNFIAISSLVVYDLHSISLFTKYIGNFIQWNSLEAMFCLYSDRL